MGCVCTFCVIGSYKMLSVCFFSTPDEAGPTLLNISSQYENLISCMLLAYWLMFISNSKANISALFCMTSNESQRYGAHFIEGYSGISME